MSEADYHVCNLNQWNFAVIIAWFTWRAFSWFQMQPRRQHHDKAVGNRKFVSARYVY